MNTEIFGIDLGTTYSAVARIDEFGMPVVIPNAEDQPTTPSAVYFETADNVAVGQTAKNSAVIDAENVVTLIKRRMGEDFKVSYYGTEYTPESISALILKQLMQDAVAQSGVDTNRVIITVPAYFGANEKDATRKAGEIAGLEVVDIIAEPVAAALAYGMKQTDVAKTIFVYDLGGGTFDTTILKISPELLEVVVIDGNRELGGADWDAKLMTYLISEFQAQTGLPDEELEDENFLQDMAIKAEELKKNLSKLESRQVPLKYGSSSAKITVTREQFEALTADLLGQTVDIVERTLEAAKAKDPGITIDEVLLVGGSSFMPAVAETLKAKFGWEPKLSDPNQSVAKGAAILAAPAPGERESVTPPRMSRPDLARTQSREPARTICRVERVDGQLVTFSIDDFAHLPTATSLDNLQGTGPIKMALQVSQGGATDSSVVAATLSDSIGAPLTLRLELDAAHRSRLSVGLGALTAEFSAGEPHSKVVS